MIHQYVLHGTARHARKGSILGILCDRDAALALDGPQAIRAVVEIASQDDADHTSSMRPRRRPKQRVDRRPGSILAGAAGEAKRSIFHQHVEVRRCDVEKRESGMPSAALNAGSSPARPRISWMMPGECGATWTTTQIGGAKSAGSVAASVRSASMPPDDVPITTRRGSPPG